MNRFRRWRLTRRVSVLMRPGEMTIVSVRGKIAKKDWTDIQIIAHEMEERLGAMRNK